MAVSKEKKSVLPALYQELETCHGRIAKLRAKHAEMFVDFDAFEHERQQLETQVKKILHERYADRVDATYTEYAGECFSVVVTTSTASTIDADKLLARYPKWRKLDGLVVTEIDREVLSKLVAEEVIDQKRVDPFVIYTPRTPAVKITPVDKTKGKKP